MHQNDCNLTDMIYDLQTTHGRLDHTHDDVKMMSTWNLWKSRFPCNKIAQTWKGRHVETSRHSESQKVNAGNL